MELHFIGKVFAALSKFFSAIPWFVYVGVAVAALWLLDRNAQYDLGDRNGYDRSQAEQRDKEEAARLAQEASALEALTERDSDTTTISAAQEGRSNAIHSTTDSKPSDASNALNCERLRRAGTSVQHIPACR